MLKNQILENAKKYVNKILMPLENYYYHSYDHALDVMERSMYLAKKEGLDKKEIEILGLAGLFHDTGFTIQYDKNEPIGSKIASNYLKTILYPEEDIKLIEQIILATSPDYKDTKNIYEKIIKDSDMDNLGRNDFLDQNNKIKKEIELVKDIKIKFPEWNHASVELLKEHKYETNSQKNERDIQKNKNLSNMIKELENEDDII